MPPEKLLAAEKLPKRGLLELCITYKLPSFQPLSDRPKPQHDKPEPPIVQPCIWVQTQIESHCIKLHLSPKQWRPSPGQDQFCQRFPPLPPPTGASTNRQTNAESLYNRRSTGRVIFANCNRRKVIFGALKLPVHRCRSRVGRALLLLFTSSSPPRSATISAALWLIAIMTKLRAMTASTTRFR